MVSYREKRGQVCHFRVCCVQNTHHSTQVVFWWVLHPLGMAVHTECAHSQTAVPQSTTVFHAYKSLHIFLTFHWACGTTFHLFFPPLLVDGYALLRAVQAHSKWLSTCSVLPFEPFQRQTIILTMIRIRLPIKEKGKEKAKETGNYLKILVQFQHLSFLFVWWITCSFWQYLGGDTNSLIAMSNIHHTYWITKEGNSSVLKFCIMPLLLCLVLTPWYTAISPIPWCGYFLGTEMLICVFFFLLLLLFPLFLTMQLQT